MLQTFYEACSKIFDCRRGLKIRYNNSLYKPGPNEESPASVTLPALTKKLKLIITLERLVCLSKLLQPKIFVLMNSEIAAKSSEDNHSLYARNFIRRLVILFKYNDVKYFVESISYPYE